MPPRRRRICCVPNCVTVKKEKEVKFIKFPDDKQLQKKWAIQVGRGPNFKPAENSRVCSKHFTSGKRTYTPSSVDYVPTVFTSSESETKEFCLECHKKVCNCNKNKNIVSEIDNKASNNNIASTYLDPSTSFEPHIIQSDETISTIQTKEEIFDSESTPMDIDNSIDGVVVSKSHYLPSSNELEPNTPRIEKVILEFHFEDQEECETGFSKVLQIPSEVIHTSEGESGADIPFLVQNITQENDSAASIVPTDIIICKSEEEKVEVSVEEPDESECDDDVSVIPINDDTSELSRPIVHCVALECNRNSNTPGIKMYPFPTAPRQRKKWTTLLRLGKNVTVPNDANLCSWHFPEGITKGPTRFHWNETKSFALNFPLSRKRRKVDPNSEHDTNINIIPDAIQKPTHSRTEDEFSMYSRNELKDQIRKLIERKKNLKIQLNNSEDEKNEIISAQKKGTLAIVTELKNQQDRWTKEKKMILEANAALAYQVKKEQLAKIALEEQIKCTGQQVSLKYNLRYENCQDTIKYFTGMPTSTDFDHLYKFLEPLARGMQHWKGNSTSSNNEEQSHSQSQIKKYNRIDNRNQLFLTLCRYKRGYTTKELGFLFGVDGQFISSIFITFSKLIESELEKFYIESHEISYEHEQRPEVVKTHYPNLFAVLGSIEIHLDFRSVVFTQPPKKRKPCPLFKVQFLFSTSGNIIFISNVYPGKMSDSEISNECKILDMIPTGSELFIDQELGITEQCINKQIQLRIFPLNPSHVLVENDPWEIKLLTTCRMKAKKLVGLIKHFRIFDNELHLSTTSNTPLIIRTVLMLQNYIDTQCVRIVPDNPSDTPPSPLSLSP